MHKLIWIGLAGLLLSLVGCNRAPEPASEAADDSGAEAPTITADDRFMIDGISPGSNLAAVNKRYEGDGKLSSQATWIDEGTGYITAAYPDGAAYPTEFAVLNDGHVIGFSQSLRMGSAEFEHFSADKTGDLGVASATPPAWASRSPLFANYSPPLGNATESYWGDESTNYVLAAYYSAEDGIAQLVVAEVEQFSTVISNAAGAELAIVVDARELRANGGVEEESENEAGEIAE